MSVGTILLIILILIFFGALPAWPHSRKWGYRPSGILGVLLIVLIVLLLMGRFSSAARKVAVTCSDPTVAIACVSDAIHFHNAFNARGRR